MNVEALTSAAIDVADRDGFEAVALTGVAAELDVAASTLYTHIDGLDGLKYLVAVAATRKLTEAVRKCAIGTSGLDALTAMALAYRGFALEHPGQFASTLVAPRSENDELATANRTLLEVFELVYLASGLNDHEAPLAARAIRSSIHGFLALEQITDSPGVHDAEYRYLIDALQRGLLHSRADIAG
ncbi:MAG: WHG domain-containing protein [Acidimicrobiia bacterium]|nr:WHG domain-containing protein [Acidimicrobiia bacterium]